MSIHRHARHHALAWHAAAQVSCDHPPEAVNVTIPAGVGLLLELIPEGT
jgi:hypothetical protein